MSHQKVQKHFGIAADDENYHQYFLANYQTNEKF